MNDDRTREGFLRLQMYTTRMSQTAARTLAELKERPRVRNPAEERLIASWRWTALQYAGLGGLCVFGAARIPPWPMSTLASATLGISSAIGLGFLTAAKEAPRVMAKLIDAPGDSDLVDRAICPSLRELEGCVNDPKCNAALQSASSSFRDAKAVLDLLERCRNRSATESAPPEEDRWYEPAPPDPPGESFDFPPQPSSDAKDYD